MQASAAETLALKGLTFLALDPSRMLRFMTASGSDLDDVRARAGDPELLAAVLDFLLSDDALLLEFAAREGIKAELLHAARRALPGDYRE